MRQIFDRTELVAEVDLVDGVLEVNNLGGDWVGRWLEDMRGGRTDTELFESLPERLRGHIWIGERVDG